MFALIASATMAAPGKIDFPIISSVFARAAELLNDPRGLAEAVIEEHEQIVGRFDKTQLSGMKIAELKALAEDCGVDVKGLKKAAIIDQLLNVPISTDPEAVLKTEV